MIAHRDDVPMPSREQPQQLDLDDIRILELVHQHIAIALPQPFQQFGIGLQPLHRLQQLPAKRNLVDVYKRQA